MAASIAASIARTSLLPWDAVEAPGHLDRFHSVFDHPPAPPLAQELEVLRGLGRDGFPARAMWNALFAGIAFQRPSVEPLLRKVARDPALLAACGFDPLPCTASQRQGH